MWFLGSGRASGYLLGAASRQKAISKEETGGVLLDIGDKEARYKLGALMDTLHKRYVLKYKPSTIKPTDRRGEINLKISPEVEKREGKLQVSFKVAR